jgi:CO/xanthine dehydrogenase Mo-binding subunit
MTSPLPLPFSLQGNARLSTWLRVDSAGFIEVRSGKVELGQGILTALAQIAAEELDVAFERIRMVAASTLASPDEAVTSGSLSIQHSGAALRHVCAQARALLLDRAADRHGVPTRSLRVVDGLVHDGERPLAAYWELADDMLLDCAARPDVTPKARSGYTVVGTAQSRPDIAQKVFGQFRFIHDVVLPDMVHGRMVRPPSPNAELLSWDADSVSRWNGVLAIARDGSLAGVVAETEALAEKAATALAKSAQWREHPTLPDADALPAWLKTLRAIDMRLGNAAQAEGKQDAHTADTRQGSGGERCPQASESAGRGTFRAAYSKPFIKHGSIGPSCALAIAGEDSLEVWSHTQGIFNLRKDLSLAFGLPETAIVVRHVQGAGCYGHNGADDVAYDAAWLARRCPGRPVRVQWSRSDELNWSPHGPAMAVELQAEVDLASGRILSWRHELWSPGHGLRPGRSATPTLLGSWYLEHPFERLHSVDAPRAAGGGADRNAEPIYRFDTTDVLCHRVLDVPLRTSSLRALGAYANVFAIESFMDELAHAANTDPLAYRLAHLNDARAITVLKKAAEHAGWESRSAPAGEGHGRGLGFARYKNTGAYCAVIAEVEVQELVRVHRLWIAVDVGLVVNPDGVRQQIEGGALQAVSWTLMEAARFDDTRLLGENWEHYPMLRFSQVPEVEIAIVQQEGHDALGAGEASLGPTAAAISNAVFDALGVRVRDLPLTFERIVGAMENQDVLTPGI